MMAQETDIIETDDRLKEVLRRLVETYHPERIYLFGSQARGDAGPDSDYDIMVIVSDQLSPEARRSRLGYRALRGTGVSVDVLVWAHTSFEERLHLKASLPSVVEREGKLLYAA